MNSEFRSVLESRLQDMNLAVERHKGKDAISYAEHVKGRRREMTANARSKRIIFLDTNAWKCISDYRLGKKTLTDEMVEFSVEATNSVQSGSTIFPLSLPTFFELESMTAGDTRKSLMLLADEMAQGYCISPFTERLDVEIGRIISADYSEYSGRDEFLVSPVELYGIPSIRLPGIVASVVSETTINKALFDVISALPMSLQFGVAADANIDKWDNSAITGDLNKGKSEIQDRIPNLNSAVFLELSGIIRNSNQVVSMGAAKELVMSYVLRAMVHWRENKNSLAFPMTHILSSLHGLVMFDRTRQFKDGDTSDFMAAASALPMADAFFTDRRLHSIIADGRLDFQRYKSCRVVSGFGEMASYLRNGSSGVV